MDGFRVASVFLLLLVPSALMGATYPALVTVLIHSREEVDRHLGWIYGVNTLGAAAGAMLAGFLLVEFLGARGSVFFANVINLAIGSSALVLERRTRSRVAADAAPEQDESIPTSLPFWVTGMVLLGSGFTTLGYEIVWFRALRYIVGNGTYVLTNVLVVFLVGLGVGALTFRWATRTGRPEWNLAFSQLGVAFFALLAIGSEQFILISEDLYERASIFSKVLISQTWQWRLFVSSAVAIAITLPATLWMGLSFPLASRLFLGSLENLSARAGLAYFMSNLGSIAGAISAALLILPRFGTVGGTKFLAALNIGLALMVLARSPRNTRVLSGCAGAILLAISLAGALPTSRLDFRGEPHPFPTQLVFEEEADMGMVQVKALESRPWALGMYIDGALIGVNRAYMISLHNKQTLLAHLPMQLDRRIRDTLNIGVATGSTIETLSRYSWVETIDAVEINPAVVRAASRFEDSAAFRDPRSNIMVEDAVHFLLRTESRYDLIINDGKLNRDNPGNAKVLSFEFYEHARERLNECGLFVQWIPMRLDMDAYEIVLRTFRAVFPEMHVFVASTSDSILVGSGCPLEGRPRPTEQDLAGGRLAAEISENFLPDPLSLPSMWVGDSDAVLEAVGDGPLNTWDRMPIEFITYRAPPNNWDSGMKNFRRLVRMGDANDGPPPSFVDPAVKEMMEKINRALIEGAFGDLYIARRTLDGIPKAQPENALADIARAMLEAFAKARR
jgi:spermidine synthase